MVHVRTKTMKKASQVFTETHYMHLSYNFHTNKCVCEEIMVIPSKKLRNKIAGYVTRLMTQIQRGPVRGVSIKLQEEERERRGNYVPDVSVLDQEITAVGPDTKEMLKLLDLAVLLSIDIDMDIDIDRDRDRNVDIGGNGDGAVDLDVDVDIDEDVDIDRDRDLTHKHSCTSKQYFSS
ncbi:PREDICTED: 40S ribosomal protein S17-like [Hipposideros armiger]|uniref:Small ribosomal subunit protein eS17 n=1 Tax=Hipposideros armiger TaxID=186990 RepID=A0A8B7T131_HIPAR|nr:PREDICTED: 40S ribosomal protein S17-like [Hipposideros armiger]